MKKTSRKKVAVAMLTCPSGHTHPATEFHTYVDMNIAETDKSISIFCPEGAEGHGFSLIKAVTSGMLTTAQAASLCVAADKLRLKERSS